MATPTSGISGLAVTVAAVGGFLIYAGIRDVETITGLREIISGKAPVGRPAKSTAQFDGRSTEIGSTVGSVASQLANSLANPLIAEARKHLGKPYVWSSVGPNSFDCSGLVIYCLRKTYDPKTPRFTTHTFSTWARRKGWRKVGEKDIRAGDVVLKSGHMGIAISNTRMIHAPNRTSVVKEAEIYGPRYMWSGWRAP